MRFIVLLMLIFSTPSYASYYGSYGVQVLQKEHSGFADVKLFNIGYQTSLYKIFAQKAELGVWSDVKFPGRSSSGYGAYSVGLRIEPGSLYLESYWGLCAITHTDTMLGSNFQFKNDTGIGIEDAAGRFIGINYSHISNAGILLPNLGRDFLAIKIGFSL